MATDAQNLESVAQEPKQTQAAEQSSQQENFAKLRKKLEAQEREYSERLARQEQELQELRGHIQPQNRNDDVVIEDSELVEGAKVKRLLAQQEEKLLRKTQEIARQTFQQIEKENFAHKLKHTCPDYENVVTEENAQKLREKDPEYFEMLSECDDPYKKRERAYKRIKQILHEETPKQTIKAQEVAQENLKIASQYFTPSGQSPMTNPYGFEFDIRNKDARTAAYAKLKAAQKKGF